MGQSSHEQVCGPKIEDAIEQLKRIVVAKTHRIFIVGRENALCPSFEAQQDWECVCCGLNKQEEDTLAPHLLSLNLGRVKVKKV